MSWKGESTRAVLQDLLGVPVSVERARKVFLEKLFLVYAHMPCFCAYRGRAGHMGKGRGRMRAIFAIASPHKHSDVLGMRGSAHYHGGREPCQCLSPRLRHIDTCRMARVAHVEARMGTWGCRHGNHPSVLLSIVYSAHTYRELFMTCPPAVMLTVPGHAMSRCLADTGSDAGSDWPTYGQDDAESGCLPVSCRAVSPSFHHASGKISCACRMSDENAPLT
jgi:hypothetical protein